MPREERKSCPAVTKTILDITLDVTNYEDLGSNGYWALGDYKLRLKAKVMPDNRVFLRGRYEGVWRTIPGAPTPESLDRQRGKAKGKFIGTIEYIFPAGTQINCRPSFPTTPPIPAPKVYTTKRRGHTTLHMDVRGSFEDILLPKDQQVGVIRTDATIQPLFTKPFVPGSRVYSFTYYSPKTDKDEKGETVLLVQNNTQSVGNILISSRGCPSKTFVA